MICWVHGAFSSDRSFNYLRGQLPAHPMVVFEYDTKTPLDDNLAALSGVLMHNKVHGIVGHSLGGVMAALMVKRGYAPKGVTIAAPLGGFHFANFLPISQLLLDVGSMRPTFLELSTHEFNDDLMTIVASHDGRTDGVVAVSSQMAVHTNKVERVDLNHFEVLLDQSISKLIHRHLFEG